MILEKINLQTKSSKDFNLAMSSELDFLDFILNTAQEATNKEVDLLQQAKKLFDTNQSRVYDFSDELSKIKDIAGSRFHDVNELSLILDNFLNSKHKSKDGFLGFIKSEFDMFLKEFTEICNISESTVQSLDYLFNFLINTSSFARTIQSKSEKRYMRMSEIVKIFIQENPKEDTTILLMKLRELRSHNSVVNSVSKSIMSSAKTTFGIARSAHNIFSEINAISMSVSSSINRYTRIFV